MSNQHIDISRRPFKKGEVIRMLEVPQDLFSRLPIAQHEALKAEVGNVHLIQDLDENGKIELEFHDENYTPHRIWINPSCVTRIFD